VNILHALRDPNVFAPYFKGRSWSAWHVFLAALFGLPLIRDQLAAFKRFTGRDTAPIGQLKEAWLVRFGLAALVSRHPALDISTA
jgi:hypothetical protein